MRIPSLALLAAGMCGCSLVYSEDGNDGDGPTTPVTPTTCPERFTLWMDSYCYREFGTADFATQVGRCMTIRHEGVAAHPAVIESAAERSALGAFLSSVVEGDAWIGLYDTDAGGDGQPDEAWYWITGRDYAAAVSPVTTPTAEPHDRGLCARITFQSAIVRRDCLAAADNLICEWDGVIAAGAYPHGVE